MDFWRGLGCVMSWWMYEDHGCTLLERRDVKCPLCKTRQCSFIANVCLLCDGSGALLARPWEKIEFIQCKEEKHWINCIFSHNRASKSSAPSHNIVCGISLVSDGLQAQLGNKAALACLMKRAFFHVSFIKQRTTVVLTYSPGPYTIHTPPKTHHRFCIWSHIFIG